MDVRSSRSQSWEASGIVKTSCCSFMQWWCEWAFQYKQATLVWLWTYLQRKDGSIWGKDQVDHSLGGFTRLHLISGWQVPASVLSPLSDFLSLTPGASLLLSKISVIPFHMLGPAQPSELCWSWIIRATAPVNPLVDPIIEPLPSNNNPYVVNEVFKSEICMNSSNKHSSPPINKYINLKNIDLTNQISRSYFKTWNSIQSNSNNKIVNAMRADLWKL